MLFYLANLLRLYLNRFTNWLVLSAFALDQISAMILKRVKARYQHWLPVRSITFNRKGRVVKFRAK